MRVIKHGERPPLKWQVECKPNPNSTKGCGAILEVEVEDLRIKKGHIGTRDDDFEVTYDTTATCPDCGKDLWMNGHISSALAEELLREKPLRVTKL
jgi:hypothetical protein